MKRVEVKLNLEAVAPLLDVIKTAADELEGRLALGVLPPGEDGELHAEWSQELVGGQESDIRILLALFGSEFFQSGVIGLDPTNCEPVLRACSALRLHLREAHLKPIDDENLESGDVPLEEMPDEQRKAFAAYVFLATLQELLVLHLDPTILEG
ncbi:MAG TPA: hypothetical protein VHD32_09970 [Candidatus Didemnitutus sp.]|nr:hypothetical protein [Candidatus Didemnitutus sp.]